ncbi:unnamed protein product [Owenia fusiformis]|uniref:Uncharacterized protein n=1 Tax=Owenia fusiformis TaxID=6347 RepID=A0A8J1U6P3_OWEFU|nr:unnamed protein product [Owenia fusiformis]
MLLVLIATLCLQWIVCNGCRCAMTHPQHYYCNSEFAVLANVVNETVNRENRWRGTRVYDIQVESVFKGEKISQVSTALHGATCGVSLQIGQQYVLTGSINRGVARIQSCNFQRRWDSLSKEVQNGFRKDYAKSCGCQITSDYVTEAPVMSCMRPVRGNWKMSRCLDRHSVCQETCDRFERCICAWTRSDNYQKCLER